MSKDDFAELLELIRRWRDDKDQDAATEIYRRYEQRLIRLAEGKLGPYLQTAVDPEEIAHMANQSLLRMAADNPDMHLDHNRSLWGLAARLAMTKIHKIVETHTAQKRDIRRRQSLEANTDPSSGDPMSEPMSEAPSPEELAQANDLLDAARSLLEPDEYAVMILRMEEYSMREIARHLKTSARSVGRKLDHANVVIRRLLDDGDSEVRRE